MSVTITNPFAPPTFTPFTSHRFVPKLGPNQKVAGLSRAAAQPSSVMANYPAPRLEGDQNDHRLKESAELLDRFGPGLDHEGEDIAKSESSVTVNDYFERAAVLVKSTGCDGGGPRWFSPVECGRPRLKEAPLLLYLPGIDGVGLGLVRQHKRLGRIFEVWCLHTPVMDRTPFAELVEVVEGTIRSENRRSPKRPIYLVGDSLGGCLALAIAAKNPDIDLVLILANPATSFNKSVLKLLLYLLQSLPRQLFSILLSVFQQVIADILPVSTLRWKMQMLKDACASANSCLHAINAQTLILTSGRDVLLPSQGEGKRLRLQLKKCEIRRFNDNGHFLFMEDGVDLVNTIKVAYFYRRGRCHDHAADYMPPTPSEFKKVRDDFWWLFAYTSPVMLSTLRNGKIVRGLEGFPSEGPTLLVGYHMFMGLDLLPLGIDILAEKNINIRGMAHPGFFHRSKLDGKLPEVSKFDFFRLFGATPVSATNMFKLLAAKSHILLYPGGLREAFHLKGEAYQLFWPEQSEFVRMAARYGAKIIPFGAIGEDDVGRLLLDYNDLVKIPYFKALIEELTNEATILRNDSNGEIAKQPIYPPGIFPKIPGRIYYLFGKPIETKGRQELQDRQKAHELYLQVKSEVERCLSYLKEKREYDPYRSIWSRLLYLSTHEITSEIPTFEP